MQWLNSLDSALDKVFLPQHRSPQFVENDMPEHDAYNSSHEEEELLDRNNFGPQRIEMNRGLSSVTLVQNNSTNTKEYPDLDNEEMENDMNGEINQDLQHLHSIHSEDDDSLLHHTTIASYDYDIEIENNSIDFGLPQNIEILCNDMESPVLKKTRSFSNDSLKDRRMISPPRRAFPGAIIPQPKVNNEMNDEEEGCGNSDALSSTDEAITLTSQQNKIGEIEKSRKDDTNTCLVPFSNNENLNNNHMPPPPPPHPTLSPLSSSHPSNALITANRALPSPSPSKISIQSNANQILSGPKLPNFEQTKMLPLPPPPPLPSHRHLLELPPPPTLIEDNKFFNEEDLTNEIDSINENRKSPENFEIDSISHEVVGTTSDDKSVMTQDDNSSSHLSNNDMTLSTDSCADFSINSSLSSWDDMTSGFSKPFDPSMNCHGLVHVRLLRAQQLNCQPGKTVYATISLPPWKGCIRTKKLITFSGKGQAGTCLRWPKNKMDKEDSSCSMIHAYNSEETPVPAVSISLITSSLKMFESELCHFSLSCEPLMKLPGVWRQKWCKPTLANSIAEKNEISVSKTNNQSVKTFKSRGPLILLEACFEPTRPQHSQHFSPLVQSNFNDDSSNHSLDQSILELRQRGLSTYTMSDMSSNAISTFGEDSISKKSLAPLSPLPFNRLTNKPHLFRISKYWTPSYCSVCASLMGWRLKAYQCEVCKLCCCSDCLIQVDVKIPCGSSLANGIVEAANSKLTFKKFMSTVAPITEKTVENPELAIDNAGRAFCDPSDQTLAIASDAKEQIHNTSKQTSDFAGDSNFDGIGILKLSVVKACLFEMSFPPETEIDELLRNEQRILRTGDYFVRVSWSGSEETKRTKTVFQSAKPYFGSDEKQLTIPAANYGTEFRIEVIDANTDKPVGTSLLTTQGILQMQRDSLMVEEGLKISSILSQVAPKNSVRKSILELRTGVKSGFGLDFFNSGKSNDPPKEGNSTSCSGEIIGWIEVNMVMVENPALYSSKKTMLCPPRKEEDFNVDLTQVHINRISIILGELREISDILFYLTSWENSSLTFTSIVIFTISCIYFDTEYIGSLPFFFMLLYMTFLGYLRITGQFKMKWVKREKEGRLQNEEKIRIKYKAHRPIGILKIGVLEGKNLCSRELGLPGSFTATIIWDPSRYLDDADKKSIAECDSAIKGRHIIACTEKSAVTSNPVWKKLIPSDETQRLHQLLPISTTFDNTHDNEMGKTSVLDASINGTFVDRTVPLIKYPILKPLRPDGKFFVDGKLFFEVEILPWHFSSGAITIQIGCNSVLNKFSVFDDILGEITVPLQKLIGNDGIKGWFTLMEKESNELVFGPTNDIMEDVGNDKSTERSLGENNDPDDSGTEASVAEIYLTVSFSPPDEDKTLLKLDNEASIVVAEEKTKSIVNSQETRVGIIGTSISTFNTVRGVRGNIQYIQNQLGNFLDIVEMIRNMLNFSCPEKSAILFFILFVLWFLLILVPTRIFILCGGLGYFTFTFMVAFCGKSKSNTEKISERKKTLLDSQDDNPISTKLNNFFMSIPTDEDLRRAYFWESKRIVDKERQELANKKRSARLGKLWRPKWYGEIAIKNSNSSTDNVKCRNWDQIYAVFQGHRLIWWRSSKNFDDGDLPLGQIYFAGHSGLATLSPIDQRELQPNELPLVLSVFGKGLKTQQKVVLLCPNKFVKTQLENVVDEICNHAKNE